jgi:hypothetical protein
VSESVFVDAVHANDFADPAYVPNPPSPPAVYYLPPAGGKMIKVADGIEFPWHGPSNRGEG